MASIPEQKLVRDDLLALTIGMFNAAAGANYLNNLAYMYESGWTLTRIANTLAERPEFSEVYSPTLNNEAFAISLTTNLLGNEAGLAATQWAQHWVKANLDAGMSRGTVIATATYSLRFTSNPDFIKVRDMLVNKLDVASYYSATKYLSSTSLADLQHVIEGVTSDPTTAVARKAVIDSNIGEPVFYTFTLTTGVDMLVASAGDDEIHATPATLSAGDVIDGKGGSDVLIIQAQEPVAIPAGVTITSVETANLVASAGIAGDVSVWTGLTTLNVTSMAGNITLKAASTTNINVTIGDAHLSLVPTVNVDISGGGAVVINANDTAITAVANPHAGIKLVFDLSGNVGFVTTRVVLAADATLEDYLTVIARAAEAGTTQLKWFQYAGDTYVADDNFGVTVWTGINPTIKLTGLVDLSAASFSADSISLTLA